AWGLTWRARGWPCPLPPPPGVPEPLRSHWPAPPLFSMLALGALGTGIAPVLLATAAGRAGATRASATTFLIPAVALALGVLIRGETVAGLSIVGGAVCLVGASLVRRAQLGARPE